MLVVLLRVQDIVSVTAASGVLLITALKQAGHSRYVAQQTRGSIGLASTFIFVVLKSSSNP